MKEISISEKDIELRKKLIQESSDIEVLYDFLNDNEISESEFEIELKNFSKLIKEFELKLILNGKNDSKDAIISIHPGAGGTESQDWAQMLYRMYSMWGESKDFKFNTIDFQSGDEAGIKDCTIEVQYYSKTNTIIHKTLIKISDTIKPNQTITVDKFTDETADIKDVNSLGWTCIDAVIVD